MIGRIVFLQTILVFSIIALTSYFLIFDPYAAAHMIYPACCGTVVLIVWTYLSWFFLTRDALDLYSMFLAATLAFNCGQIFLEVLGLNAHGMLQNKFEPQTLFQTILFVCLTLSCVHLGALVQLSRKEGPSSWQGIQLPASPALLRTGLLLIAVSALPTILVIYDLYNVVRVSGYFGIYQQADQVGFNNIKAILAAYFIPGLLFALAGAKDSPKIRPFIEITLITHAMIFIILGRRGDGAETLVTYAIVRNYCIAPMRKAVLVPIALFFLIIVFPLIAVIRNISLENRADFSVMFRAYQSIDNPASAALGEMGGSMQSISYTIDLVPKTRAYDLGGSYFYSFLSVVPNLFWKLHPSVAHGSPSVWLVTTVEPDIADKHGGIGFSYIAEAYLNFGWWGGPIVLFLIGYWLCGLVKWSQFTGDPARVAMAASFFSSLLTFARADSQSVIRPLFWYALVPYLIVRFLEKRNRLGESYNQTH